MTEGKPIGIFPLLLAGVAVLLLVGIAALANNAGTNPEIDGRTVKEWLTIQQKGSYDEKRNAEDHLVKRPDQSVPGLIYFLERRPNPVHVVGVKVWNRILPKKLKVPDYTGVRASSARILGLLGTNGAAAVPALMEAAVEQDWTVGEQARSALLRMATTAAPAVANRLGRSDPLEHQLKWAAILDGMGSGATNAIVELIDAFRRSPPGLRAEILGLFEQIPFHVESVTDLLMGAASKGDVPERCAALRSLGCYEDIDDRIRMVISMALKHESFSVRFNAAYARCRLNLHPEEVLPILIEGLTHAEHRVGAVSLLGDLREVAEPAIPDLIRTLMNERNPRPLRNPPAAGVALSRIGNASLVPVTTLLQNDDPAVILNAVITLGVFRQRAFGAADALRPLLRHSSEQVRQATALTLASIGDHSREAVPVLLIIAEDDDPFTATWANDALFKIDPKLTIGGAAR